MTKIKVGQKVNVLHGDCDCDCGDTTVIAIESNGSFELANGFKFKKDGTGFYTNRKLRVGPAIHRHNDVTLPYAVRWAAFKKFRDRKIPR